MKSDRLVDYIRDEPYLFSQYEKTLPELLLGASPSQLYNCRVDEVSGVKWVEIVDKTKRDNIRRNQLPYIDMGMCGFYAGTAGNERIN